jgi:hypothetical protein
MAETVQAITDLIREFGFPIAVAVGLLALIGTGVLRWGKGVIEDQAFREQLRLEERKGRLEAEARLDVALEVAKDATDLANRYAALIREKLPNG